MLVATDLGLAADEAIREGIEVARAVDGAFAVVHAVPAIKPGAATTARKTRRKLELLVREQIRRAVGKVDVEVFIEEGTTDRAISLVASGWEASVIVVGARRRSLWRQLTRGVGERLARRSGCPILVARHRHGHGGVIAATDLSKPMFPAIVAGASEAERRHAPLKVVHAVGFLAAEMRYLLRSAKQRSGSDLSSFREELEATMADLGLDQPCQILGGSAAEAILRDAAAIDAELIVLATRADPEGGYHAVVRGVVEEVVSNAPCSVLIVRAPTAEAA